METNRCIKCKEEKEYSEFHKNREKLKGISNICKVCANIKAAEYRKKRPKPERTTPKQKFDFIKIHKPTQSDYCGMFELLEKMGYDIHSGISIHEQFCLKYGLKTKRRGKKFMNKFEVKDCQQKTPTLR